MVKSSIVILIKQRTCCEHGGNMLLDSYFLPSTRHFGISLLQVAYWMVGLNSLESKYNIKISQIFIQVDSFVILVVAAITTSLSFNMTVIAVNGDEIVLVVLFVRRMYYKYRNTI